MMKLLKSSLLKIKLNLMTKFMCMIRNGKFIYWTDKFSRIESPEPMRDIDLEQIECYFKDNPNGRGLCLD